MVCFVFGAGESPDSIPLPRAGDYVIAADGGLDACHRFGITPDLTVGDFDSLGRIPEGEAVLRLPVEKDETDMVAAVRLGQRKGYHTFYLFGGTGGRPDHTFANYQVLAALAEGGDRGYLFGRTHTAVAISSGSSLTFPPEAEGDLSVFSVGGDACGVTERGVYYPLENATLTPTNPLGVSNRFLPGTSARISVDRGTLLLFFGGNILPKILDT